MAYAGWSSVISRVVRCKMKIHGGHQQSFHELMYDELHSELKYEIWSSRSEAPCGKILIGTPCLYTFFG